MDDSNSTNTIDEIVASNDKITNKQNLYCQDDKGVKLTTLNKSPYTKASNGISMLAVPLILKRSRACAEKSDSLESNENIDENKKEVESNIIVKEATQRSSNRKKIKKSFGSDFLDMDDGQYSNARYASKKQRTKDCSYCLKNDGDIHHCKYCRIKGHETCFQANLGVSREGYKNKVVICKSCRTNCEICDKTDRAGELYFCSRCSSVFHKSCDTNLNRLSIIVFGEWQCSFCDTLDSLVGDSLTEEQRKKEINRRKLLAMRKRLRKSDYILENGLCSIQQVVKQAVKKRRIEIDQAHIDNENKIELSDDELHNSKHILNENQQMDFWLEDDSIDFNRLEDFLKKQRKNQNILSKHIREDKKYYLLVKVLIDQLKEDKFHCKKNSFLKVLNSDLFKRSFFEHNTLNGLTKGSTFLEGLTKCIEKCVNTEYWKTSDVNEDSIGQKEFFANESESKNPVQKSSTDFEFEKNVEDKEGENNLSKNNFDKKVFENEIKESKSNEKIISSADIEQIANYSENDDDIRNYNFFNQYKIYLEDESFTPEDEQSEKSNDQDEALESRKMNSCDDPNNMKKENIKTTNINKTEEVIEEMTDESIQEIDQKRLKNDFEDGSNNNLKSSNQETEKKLDRPQIISKLTERNSNKLSTLVEKSNQEEVFDQLVITKESKKVNLCKNNFNEESISDNEPYDLMCDEMINEKAICDESYEVIENRSNIISGKNLEIQNESFDKQMNDKLINKLTEKKDKSNITTNEKYEYNNQFSADHRHQIRQNIEKKDKLVGQLFKESSSKSNSSSTSESRPVSQNSQKAFKSAKYKINKSFALKQSKSSKQKLKIKPSNNLVDKLFKRACKYNLNLLEPKYWSSEDVSIYLKQIGFENEAQYFKEKLIDGKTLLKLSRQEVLKNFGMKLGVAVKIFAYIHDLQIKNRCNIIFD